VLLNLALTRNRRITPVVYIGAYYATMLKYKDEATGILANDPKSYVVEGLNYTQSDFYIHASGTWITHITLRQRGAACFEWAVKYCYQNISALEFL
jgi:hypothetical protein